MVLSEIFILNKGEKVYDLGSGKSFFSVVVAFLGYNIFAVDSKIDFLKLNILKKIFKLKKLYILKKDIGKMKHKDFEKNISVVYSTRFLHYLKYREAEKLLKIIAKNPEKRWKSIFFSFRYRLRYRKRLWGKKCRNRKKIFQNIKKFTREISNKAKNLFIFKKRFGKTF